jgi:haloacetate dehalogenase
MFEGVTLQRINVGEAELRVRHGGSGPPVLLLHGHPRTHVEVLGHRRFSVAGHDRGSYVAQRLAMDHPARCAACA